MLLRRCGLQWMRFSVSTNVRDRRQRRGTESAAVSRWNYRHGYSGAGRIDSDGISAGIRRIFPSFRWTSGRVGDTDCASRRARSRGTWQSSSVVEQRTHKPLVGGSNPPSATRSPAAAGAADGEESGALVAPALSQPMTGLAVSGGCGRWRTWRQPWRSSCRNWRRGRCSRFFRA